MGVTPHECDFILKDLYSKVNDGEEAGQSQFEEFWTEQCIPLFHTLLNITKARCTRCLSSSLVRSTSWNNLYSFCNMLESQLEKNAKGYSDDFEP